MIGPANNDGNAAVIAPIIEETHVLKPSEFPRACTVQRGLLVATFVLGILSLIPPLRFGAAIALRSVALLSSVTACADPEAPKDAVTSFSKAARVGIVVLGIVAMAISAPVLITASLAADMGVQILQAAQAAQKGEGFKVFVHLTVLVVDALVLTAMITGAWQLIVIAAAVSVLMMIVLVGSQCHDNGNLFDGTMYVLLALLGVATIIATSEIPRDGQTKLHFTYKNDGDKPVDILNKKGDVVATVQPGETKEIYTAGYSDSRNGAYYDRVTAVDRGFAFWKLKVVQEGSDPSWLYSDNRVVIPNGPPLPAVSLANFPTVPLSTGNAVGAIAENMPQHEGERTYDGWN